MTEPLVKFGRSIVCDHCGGVVDNALDHGHMAVQFILGNPKRSPGNIYPKDPAELKAFNVEVDEITESMKEAPPGFVLAVHAAFPVTVRGLVDRPYIRKHVLSVLGVIGKMGASVYNLHMGHTKGITTPAQMRDMLRRMVEKLSYILRRDRSGVRVVIENEVSGFSLVDLHDFYVMMPDKLKARMGFCIDTAHLWGRGIVLGKCLASNLDWLSDLFPDDIYLFHLNNSRVKYGSGEDRHGSLLSDEIPADTIRAFVERFAGRHAAFILESPRDDPGLDALAEMAKMYN